MFSSDDFDNDIVDAANHVDKEFLLASQLNEMEQRISKEKSREEEKDFELALKLSEELNSSNSRTNVQDHPSTSPDISLHRKAKQIARAPLHTAVNSDYLLALRLSQTDHNSPPREQTDTRNSSEDYDSDFDDIMFNDTDSDYLLAVKLSQSDYISESKPAAENRENVSKYLNKEMSVVHPNWETIDPNPDIYSLFVAFNKRFFWGKLDMVEVQWSPRMTSCAGICSYRRTAGHCVVKLSKPLLLLRPRKDLVETLLHEMIHAYLFVTKNDRDRDGHGPQFHSHMYRINRESGANISVYHNFHDEVKFYKNHEWRCNGPCRNRPPYFGYVRRSMNRAPGPYDDWWSNHSATCGGDFLKTKEPEQYTLKKAKANSNKKDSRSKDKGSNNDIRNFFKIPSTKMNMSISSSSSSSTSAGVSAAVKVPSPKNMASNTTSASRNVFTLSDLVNNKKSPKKKPSSSPKKWVPLPGQRNILHFVSNQ